MSEKRKQHERLGVEEAVWDDRFRAILDSSLDAVITMNSVGQIVDWNCQAELVFGWTKEEAIGQPLGELIIPPAYRDAHHVGLQRYLSTGEGPVLGQRLELTALRKHGEEFPVELSVVAIPLDDQVVFTAFLRDISERTEDALYRTRMAALVDSSYDAIIGKDIAGVIISWNLGAERVYGYTEEQAVGQTIAMILPPGVEQEEPEIIHAARTGLRLEQFETVRRRKDGNLIPVSLTVSPISDNNGTIIGISTIERDITDSQRQKEELRQAKEAAEEATRIRAEFLANVSHELRTPMNAIIGMTRITLDEDVTDDVRDYVQTANDAAHSLLTLLNDILDFSKIESGKFTIEKKPFSLRTAIDETVKTLSTRAFEKGLELAYHIDDVCPDHLIGDPIRLRQVLTNLIGNAIKFTDHGEVLIAVEATRTWPQETRLQFFVRDTGIGIPEEDQRRILEPFTQVDATSTRQYGGTGLGLAICTELVQLMGGRMLVQSEVGRGSCFSFHLSFERQAEVKAERDDPAAYDPLLDRRVPVASGHASRTRSGPSLSVLLAEDTPANQKVVTTILRKRGHCVTVAQNGREAVELNGRQTFDVVLMDVQMPVMDGLQATSEIRKHERKSDRSTPVIAMTAHAMRGDREMCLEAGMDAYLSKPINANRLIELVESISVDSAQPHRTDRTSESAALQERSRSVDSSELIDFDGTMTRLAGDMELFHDFIDYFDEDSRPLLDALRDAIAAQDASAIQRAAHSLKGLAANFGASACESAAHEMEALGRSKDVTPAEVLLPRLEYEVERLAKELGNYKK